MRIVGGLLLVVLLSAPGRGGVVDHVVKGGHGVLNILSCPLEIPATIYRCSTESNPISGVLSGGMEGIGNMSVRFVGGVVDLVTCPLPVDTDSVYDRPLGQTAVRME